MHTLLQLGTALQNHQCTFEYLCWPTIERYMWYNPSVSWESQGAAPSGRHAGLEKMFLGEVNVIGLDL